MLKLGVRPSLGDNHPTQLAERSQRIDRRPERVGRVGLEPTTDGL
jgi:hypothetical protein